MDQTERLEALKMVRYEMETIVAEQLIRQAHKCKLLPATKYLIKQGDEVKSSQRKI